MKEDRICLSCNYYYSSQEGGEECPVCFSTSRQKLNTEHYPDNNPKTVMGMAKLDLSLVPSSAIIGIARAMADGAKKYGPFNWRDKTISSMVYIAAAFRHIYAWVDGEDYAEDSGVHHLDHAMACLGLLRDAESIGMLNDNRPTKGAAARLLKEKGDE